MLQGSAICCEILIFLSLKKRAMERSLRRSDVCLQLIVANYRKKVINYRKKVREKITEGVSSVLNISQFPGTPKQKSKCNLSLQLGGSDIDLGRQMSPSQEIQYIHMSCVIRSNTNGTLKIIANTLFNPLSCQNHLFPCRLPFLDFKRENNIHFLADLQLADLQIYVYLFINSKHVPLY